MCYLGLDLGQKHDYSAIAIVDMQDRMRGQQRPANGRMVVRYLERAPLGTTYPAVVEQVKRLVQSQMLRQRCAVIADATGVGAPVVDLLRGARLGCEVTAVTITGGARESGYAEGPSAEVRVPKQDLIAGVQVLLESGELRIAARLRHAGTLVKELLDVRVRGGLRGRLRIGADGAGEHDDLVIALALAIWRAKRGTPTFGPMPNRLGW
ncbi:MAG: hypothetical protein QOJ99_4491 [Bryobacterales bacterium]|jgi:hypothetical protein|nr:hypothetical protein [Bryobacterales bacterium]